MKLTLKAGVGATPISLEDAIQFLGSAAIQAGEKRGEITTAEPWRRLTAYRALAVTATWKPGPTYDYVDEYTLHGDRTMSDPKESGYDLEGWTSIDDGRV